MATSTEDITEQQSDEQTQQPSQYWIVVHNCDFVALPEVVESIHSTFGVDYQTAMGFAKTAHDNNEAPIVRYTLDIAETKAQQAQQYLEAWHESHGVDEPSSIFEVRKDD